MTKEIKNHYFNKDLRATEYKKYGAFMHLFPYMLKPNAIKEFQMPISLHIQNELADEFSDAKLKKLKIEFLEGINIDKLRPTSNEDFHRYFYHLEKDFYEKQGGDKELLVSKTIKDIEDFVKDKAVYLMGVHALVSKYISMSECSDNASIQKCILSIAKTNISGKNVKYDVEYDDRYLYQTLAEKGLEEGAWKEFKRSAHLIYGYIETLIEEGEIPHSTTKTPVSFIKEDIAKIILDFDEHYNYVGKIMKKAMAAQKCLLKKHKNSSKDIDYWLLPADFSKIFK